MKSRIGRGKLFVVAMLMCFWLGTTVAFAANDDSGSCGPNVTYKYTSADKTLTISGTGEMQDWDSYKSTPWSDLKDNIKSVVINNGVTKIGDFAFADCLNLTSITLPLSVTNIGHYALQRTDLTEIHIDNPIPPSVGYACFWAVNQSACKLYVPQGTQRAYADILDWCFFDIVGCDGSCYNIYVQESKHIRLELHHQILSITSEQLAVWLSNLDRVYEKYADLLGGNIPNKGSKIVIQSVGPEIEAWARAVVGGNNIYWNSTCVSESLNAFVNDGDWSFGILHEIGHNFDKGTEPNWLFHAEITANLKAIYAIDAIPDCHVEMGVMIYSLQDIYDYFYDYSIQDDGDDDRYTDKITLGFIKVAQRYGWNVFTKTFNSYWDNSYPYNRYDVSDAGKYNEFIDRLEYFSGSADIRSECFNTNNWLATIERHYTRNASACKTPPEYDYTLPAPTRSWQNEWVKTESNKCYIYRVEITSGNTYSFNTDPAGGV